MQEAIARGIQIETLGEKVVVNFTPTKPSRKICQLLQETLNAIDKAKSATGKADQEVLFVGLKASLPNWHKRPVRRLKPVGPKPKSQAEQNKKAQIAEDELKVALRQEIGQGLVDVERQKIKSLSLSGLEARLRRLSPAYPEAIEIMNRIAKVNADGTSDIKVSGHTDDVPLIFGSSYRDNEFGGGAFGKCGTGICSQ